jgi:RNA polymerase sigma-70 factor (ECF subfamily)
MQSPKTSDHHEAQAGAAAHEADERAAMAAEDAQLARASSQGDAASFGKLYDRHFKAVYRFIAYRVSDTALAQDLTSQAFLKALEHIGSFDGRKASFLTWVMRIARNTLIDAYRTHRATEDIDELDIRQEGGDVSEDIDTRAKLEELRRALAALPQEQRDIIRMRVWDGLSYREIGQVLGKSEASCKMMASRTLRSLRGKISLAAFALLVASCI